jgi:hypothetical protein
VAFIPTSQRSRMRGEAAFLLRWRCGTADDLPRGGVSPYGCFGVSLIAFLNAIWCPFEEMALLAEPLAALDHSLLVTA